MQDDITNVAVLYCITVLIIPCLRCVYVWGACVCGWVCMRTGVKACAHVCVCVHVCVRVCVRACVYLLSKNIYINI